MPQQWVPMPDPYAPEKKKSNYDWEPMPDPYAAQQAEANKSLWDKTVTWPNAVRMGGSVAGDYLGAALAPFTFGAAYPALSFIGGAGSELAAQWMEDKPFNYGLAATEGALNLVPGPNIPGRGAALGEVLQQFPKAAAYGAGQGLMGSVPRHIAETGQWELPSAGEMFGQTVMGGVVGGGTGTVLAGANSMLPKYQPPQMSPSIMQGPQLPNNFQQMLPGFGSPDIPGTYRAPQSGEQSINLGAYTPEVPRQNAWDPTTSPTPTGDPNQGELNFSHYTPMGGGNPTPIQKLQNSGPNDFGNLGPPTAFFPPTGPQPTQGVPPPPSAPPSVPQARVQSDDRVFLPYTDGLNLSLGDPLATGGNLGPAPTMADMAPRPPVNNAPPPTQAPTQPTGTPPFASLLNIPPDVLAINPDTAEATILKPSKELFGALVNANYKFGYQDRAGQPVWIPDPTNPPRPVQAGPPPPPTVLPNHPAIPKNAQPKDIGTRVEVDTVDEAEVARALKPEGFVLVGRTKQGKSIFEIPQIRGGSDDDGWGPRSTSMEPVPTRQPDVIEDPRVAELKAQLGQFGHIEVRPEDFLPNGDITPAALARIKRDIQISEARSGHYEDPEDFRQSVEDSRREPPAPAGLPDIEVSPFGQTPSTGQMSQGVAPFVRPENIGKDHYRLPDGQVVPTDPTATKGQAVIDFQLANREIVKAVLVHKGQVDKWGDPLTGPAQSEVPPRGELESIVSITQQISRTTQPDQLQQIVNNLTDRVKNAPNNRDRSLATAMLNMAEKKLNEVNSAAAWSRMSDPNKPLAITESTISEVPPSGGPKGTTGTRWQGQVDELDKAGAPDAAYRAIIASPGTKALAPGETWRDRVMKGIEFFKKDVKDFLTSGPGGTSGEEGAVDLGSITRALEARRAAAAKAMAEAKARGEEVDERTWKERLGWGMGATEAPEKKSLLRKSIGEILALPSGLTTTLDFSAPFRQGIGLIHDREFWKALPVGVKSVFSKEVADRVDKELRNKPIFIETRNARTKQLNPSYAEQIGFKLMEAGAPMSKREEALASDWVDKIPMFRGTNRGFRTFLNVTRTNVLEKLLNEAHAMSKVGEATGEIRPNIFKQKVTQEQAQNLDPFKNLVIGKEFADFVNTATGRGPLRGFALPYQSTEINLEFMANALSKILFSPRLMASRLRMLSPATYVMASPQVRKQYMLSMLATMGAWGSVAALGKMAGGDVETDLTSSDFGKIKIGNTRLDPGAGFQQYLVAGARALRGGYTSAATGQYHRYGSGFQATTQADAGERFFVNKLNPITKFWYDIANASQYQPFHTMDRTMQMFVPLAVQDSIELYRENPKLLALLAPIMVGMGTQTYDKGESVGKLLPAVNDVLGTRIKEQYITGGGPLGPFFRR